MFGFEEEYHQITTKSKLESTVLSEIYNWLFRHYYSNYENYLLETG